MKASKTIFCGSARVPKSGSMAEFWIACEARSVQVSLQLIECV